tara:strand:- start:1340 stop:1609 length:270 start_codon:yes stop_codon:yes gene_type:complete
MALVWVYFCVGTKQQRNFAQVGCYNWCHMLMSTEKIEFLGHSGHMLAACLGRLGPKDGFRSDQALGCILFAHCATCSKIYLWPGASHNA